MKTTILVFSPSGNTAKVANLFQQKLKQWNVKVQMLNITGNSRIFKDRDHAGFLKDSIAEHDILCIGGPVYAHHLQYHLLDLLESLPEPGNGWGSYAFPFVTYGGICSGVALEEAGDLLTKSGRKVLGGMKIAAAHNMTRAFMEQPINHHLPSANIVQLLNMAIKKIISLQAKKSCTDQMESLKYQPPEVSQKAKTIFIEKEWHKIRYPQVMINADRCRQCKRCISICPVNHLEQDSSGNVIQNEDPACIHCFNCVITCPTKAISLLGNQNQARVFIGNMLQKGNEVPESAVLGI